MKKLDKMTTLSLMSTEVDIDFNFTSSVKMDNVKIGRGGGQRICLKVSIRIIVTIILLWGVLPNLLLILAVYLVSRLLNFWL
jgi:hypothetical protein